MLVPVPPMLRERIGDFDPAAAAPAKDAATIAVVRDGDHGLEAFLMRRHSGMAFAPGMYVFPGGRVETLRGYAGLGGDIFDPYGGPPEAYIKTALRVAEAVEAAVPRAVAAVLYVLEERGVVPEPAQSVGADPAFRAAVADAQADIARRQTSSD